MPNSNPQNVRLRYLEHLGELISQLEKFLVLAKNNNFTSEDGKNLRSFIPRLRSVGTVYGLIKINHAVHDVEVALMRDLKPATPLIEPLEQVLAACNDAVKFGPEPVPHSSSTTLPLLLVVDDDETIRDFIQDLLQSDAHVIAAKNTQEALGIMQSHKPDLVILDNSFPDAASGFRLLQNRKAIAEICDIPVIMVTASNKPQDIELGMKAGAIDYITKPFHPVLLVEKIIMHLNRVKFHSRA